MSLTKGDLSEIRSVVKDEVEIGLSSVRSIFKDEMNRGLSAIRGKLKALANDIKDIYQMISDIQHTAITDRKFEKLTIEKKLLTLNAELLNTARQVGITLPR